MTTDPQQIQLHLDAAGYAIEAECYPDGSTYLALSNGQSGVSLSLTTQQTEALREELANPQLAEVVE